jgi:hypothetical protein
MSQEHKRRFRFSSRTLLLGVAILAVLFATLGQRSVRQVNERRATSEILRLGGRFDYQHATSLKADGWSSRLMAFVLYEDFARVTGVSVNRTGIRDDDLAIFKLLTGLEGLDISSTNITDASVVHLAAIPDLKYLNAHQTKLTEAGVAELKSLRPSLLVDWQ